MSLSAEGGTETSSHLVANEGKRLADSMRDDLMRSLDGPGPAAAWQELEAGNGAPGGLASGSPASMDREQSQQQQANLRARQSQLASALELAKLGPWEYDVAADLFTFNDHFYAIFRTTAEKEGGYRMSPGRYAERFVHPEDKAVVGIETRRALETTDPNYRTRLEHRIVYADGEIGYISVSIVIVKDEQGRTIKTYGVNQDITERVRAKKELQDAHDQLRLLHENVEDALFSIDLVHEKMLYASPGHERIFGYPVQAFFQNPALVYELVVADDKPLVDAGLLRLWRGESWGQQCRILRLDGQVRWLEIRMTPTVDADGALVRVDGIASDVTERVNAEEKRQQLEMQLRQAQKVESLGTLAGGIAHDFNNILGIVVGYVSLIERSKSDAAVVARAVQAISRATARGTALVSQLLTFARESDVVYAQVDVEEVIREMVKLFDETFPKTITTELRLSPHLRRAYGSAPQIHQLLLNLCINGRDAMPHGGVLTISTDLVAGEAVKRVFSSATASEYLRVQVRDTGVGMNEATRQRIFEPFFTTKGVGKGTGLGLAVAYGIVESHRGHITVESEPGRGTAFTVYLRTSEQRAPVEPQSISVREAGLGGSETILVVEDEELLRSMLRSVFEAQGYAVLTAADGSEGVRVFEVNRDRIAAVVSDVGLPELNGADVVRRIKRRSQRVKCVLMSGFMTPEMTLQLQQSGAARIVTKPFDPVEVVRAVRNAIDNAA